MNLHNIITLTLTLFAIVDIIGNYPTILSLRQKYKHINSLQATLVSLVIMLLFMFIGESMIGFIGLDIFSFSIAGAVIIFIMGMEMILNVTIFKPDPENPHGKGSSKNISSIVPIAFPLIAGPGTLSTILSLQTIYTKTEMFIGIALNMLIVYLALKTTKFVGDRISQTALNILRKVFGIILIAMAIKMLKTAMIDELKLFI